MSITAKQKQYMEELLLANSPEEVYQMVLDSRLTRFPMGFWSMPENYKYGELCTRYLVEVVMGWDLEIAKQRISLKVFQENKLNGMLAILYNSSPASAFIAAYPEVNMWECKATPMNYWNDATVRENLRRIYLDELRYTRNDLINESWAESLRANRISTVQGLYPSIHALLEVAFPEMAITQSELDLRSFCHMSVEQVADYIIRDYLPSVGAYSDSEVIYALSHKGVKYYENWELFTYLYCVHKLTLREILDYTFPSRILDWQICVNKSKPWTLELLIEALRYKLYIECQLSTDMIRQIWCCDIMEKCEICSMRTAYKLIDSSSSLYYYVTGEMLSEK